MTQVSRTRVRSRAGAPRPQTGTSSPAPSISGRLPGEITKLTGVFFGPPKTGKTTAATSGKDSLLLQFDPDGDLTKTLRGRKDITVVEPQGFKEMEKIVRALHTTDAGRFPFVAVDSVTFFFQMVGGVDITKAYMANKNIMRPYGKAGAAVSQIIADLVRIPKTSVFFTAHLQKEDEEDGVVQDTAMGEHEVKLAVTPMVWKTLGPAVSFIGRTFKQTEYEKGKKLTKYRVSFNDGDRSPAGARIELPGEVEITTTLMQELADKLIKEV